MRRKVVDMFKAIGNFLNKRVVLLLRIVAILSILLGGLFIMISTEMFSHGQAFVFLGFISVLINAIGILSGILLLIRVKNELAVSLLRNFAVIGLIFVLFYSLIGNEFNTSFLIFIAIWIIIYLFTRTNAVMMYVTREESQQKTFAPGQRYIQMHWLLSVYIIGSLLLFLLIWVVDWETQARFYREPNGGGISNFVSETDSPKLSANVEGGFVVSVGGVSPDYSSDYLWNSENDSESVLGEIKVKLVSPDATITLYPQETGRLRINLLNFPSEAIVELNGNELSGFVNLSRDHWTEDRTVSSSLDEIISGRHLTRLKGIVFDIDVEVGSVEEVNIKHVDNPLAESELRFVVISDLHSGYNIFMPEWPGLIDFDPAFGIANGDLTNLGYPSEYMMIASAFELAPFPLYTTIGNHDAWNGGGSTYNKYFGPNNYSFVYENARFIFLDSSSGIIGETQFIWLETELENNDEDFVFVITHMPPIDTVSGEFDTSNTLHPESLFTIHSKSESDYFLYLMDEYDVDVVLAGHTHVHGVSEIDGTTYVTSGVLGGSVKPGNDIGYLEVTVTDSDIFIEHVDILSVEEAGGKAFENYVQALRVFAMPFLINNSIRIALSMFLLVGVSLLWIPIRRKLMVTGKSEAMIAGYQGEDLDSEKNRHQDK